MHSLCHNPIEIRDLKGLLDEGIIAHASSALRWCESKGTVPIDSMVTLI